ncbi:MAG: DUF5074 domain-containing protein [Ilumatobacter sp.]
MQKRVVVSGALAVAAASTFIGVQLASGSTAASETVFVPVAPCRLVDTRPGDLNVGPVAVQIGAGQDATFTAWGTGDANSLCDIPATATAIATNTTAVRPTARTFVTLYPADVANPGTSNLNVTAGATPTPNAANVPLSSDGKFNVFNNAGSVDIIVDVNGYFQPSTAIGATGPAGAPGADGANGQDGADGQDGAANRITNEQIAVLAWHEAPGTIATIPVGTTPIGIAFSGTALYVINAVSSDVSVIDPVTNEAIGAPIPIEQFVVSDFPTAIAFDGTHMYVASASGNVSVIDPTTNAVIGDAIPVGDFPRMIAYDGTHLYVGNEDSDNVTVIDPATKAVVGPPIGLSDSPRGIAFDGTNIYVTLSTGVAIIDPTTKTVSNAGSPIAVGNSPLGMAYDGTYLYVVNTSDDTVSVVDPSTETEIDTIAVGDAPLAIAYDGTYLYVTNSDDNNVSVIDPATRSTVGAPVPAGFEPVAIAFDGTSLFIANSNDDSVSKIPAR